MNFVSIITKCHLPKLGSRIVCPNYKLGASSENVIHCRYSSTETEPENKKKVPEYVVSFKKTDIKQTFKTFYSLYGPLFMACHISISLASLGFWNSIIWLTVDPLKYMPDAVVSAIGSHMITEGGSKFLVAYAVHKMILPIRLGGSIYLTKILAPKVQEKWKSLKSKS